MRARPIKNEAPRLVIPMKRFLLLEGRPDLGQPQGQNRFSLETEAWEGIRQMLPHIDLEPPRITKVQAGALADLLDSAMKDDGWRATVAGWGDADGRQMAEFIRFLRGGEFVVMVLKTGEPPPKYPNGIPGPGPVEGPAPKRRFWSPGGRNRPVGLQ